MPTMRDARSTSGTPHDREETDEYFSDRSGGAERDDAEETSTESCARCRAATGETFVHAGHGVRDVKCERRAAAREVHVDGAPRRPESAEVAARMSRLARAVGATRGVRRRTRGRACDAPVAIVAVAVPRIEAHPRNREQHERERGRCRADVRFATKLASTTVATSAQRLPAAAVHAHTAAASSGSTITFGFHGSRRAEPPWARTIIAVISMTKTKAAVSRRRHVAATTHTNANPLMTTAPARRPMSAPPNSRSVGASA